jgi:hypothetical protein
MVDAKLHKLDDLRGLKDQYRDELDAALGRELSLLRELYAVKKQLAALTGGSVLPIRGLEKNR